MKKFLVILPVLASVVIMGASQGPSGCSYSSPSADDVQARQQENSNRQANAEVGFPAVTNFFEKKQMKRIIEMRDNPKLLTYTYRVDLNGRTHFVCASIGFPLSGATQFTNSSRLASEYLYPSNGTGQNIGSATLHTVDGVLPQSDPSGLFTPPSEDATWVLCQNPNDPNDFEPTYHEDKVDAYPWKDPTAIDDTKK